MPASSPTPAPRRFRFSLRTLLGWILVLSVLLGAGRWVYVRTWLQASVAARLQALDVTPEYAGHYVPSTSEGPKWRGLPEHYIQFGRPVLGVKIPVPFRSDKDAEEVNRLLRQLPCLVDATASFPMRSGKRGSSDLADRHFATAINGLPLRGVLVRWVELRGGETAKLIHRTKSIRYFHMDGRLVLQPDEWAEICQSPHIRRIELTNTALTHEQFSILAKARQLDRLHLAGVFPYERLSELGKLPHCELGLAPEGTTDEDLIEHIAALPNLTWLSLAFESPTDEAVASLAGAQRLRWLGLQDTTVGDAAIEPLVDLPALEGLQVGGTNVTETGLLPFARCQSLRWLCVPNSADIPRLRNALPQVEDISSFWGSWDAAAARVRRRAAAAARQTTATSTMPP